jgi:large subunit ribosomal protein L21
MFGTLSILFGVLQSFAGKKNGSSSSTESSTAERAEPPAVHPVKPAVHPARPAVHPAKPAELPARSAKPAVRRDDLRRIEGIGPKVSSVLVEAGITTFSQLAASPVEQLKDILAAGGFGALVDPSSWPEQAGLAETGDWDAFQKLKDELVGGRRI